LGLLDERVERLVVAFHDAPASQFCASLLFAHAFEELPLAAV
jgi:hypothetical protein